MKTVRKTSWQGRKPQKAIKGSPLNYSAAEADRYYYRLRSLITQMTSETATEVYNLFKAAQDSAMDASLATQAKLLFNKLAIRFAALFGNKAPEIADETTTANTKHSAASLKLSLHEIAQGFTLKTDIFTPELTEILKATVAENVALIKSIPQQYLLQIQGEVMRSITTGRGLADLTPFLSKRKEITLKRAKLIAHDQTRKATSNINRVRMEKLGIKQFEWIHSHGSQEPRPLHQEYDRKIFDFDNPPVIDERTGERGYPGQLINCKCKFAPVFSFLDE